MKTLAPSPLTCTIGELRELIAATSPGREEKPFTLGELRELALPPRMAVRLSTESRAYQVMEIRRRAGLTALPRAARGLTIRTNARLDVLAIEPD